MMMMPMELGPVWGLEASGMLRGAVSRSLLARRRSQLAAR